MTSENHKLTSDAGLAHLAFDSHYLGGPVYRLTLAGPPTERDFADIEQFIEVEKPHLIFTRTPAAWSGAFKASRFREMERLLTFERGLQGEDRDALPPSIRLAVEEDADRVAGIAGKSFFTDRYHTDPNIDDRAADALKSEWARNNVMGRADATFVAIEDGRLVGFNSCLLSQGIAMIDLIATDPEERGRGLGKTLVQAAIAHYAKISKTLRVGTQAANEGSRALYEGFGFTLAEEQATFHLHAHFSAGSGS